MNGALRRTWWGTAGGRSIAVVAVSLALTIGPSAARETPGRHALVIGNKSYASAPLRNTVNDASAIATKLESIGFEVTLSIDVTKAELREAVSGFYETVGEPANAESLAVFYYAGHAVQLDHRNFLVPLDIGVEDTKSFLGGLFDINELFSLMPRSVHLQHVIILDACRDNPLGEHGAASDLVTGRGLAPVRAPPGTLIAYATEPGSVALDGEGKHGTYTEHLLRHIDKRTKIENIFRDVRKDVLRATANGQVPWEHSSLTSDVYLSPPRNRKFPELLSF